MILIFSSSQAYCQYFTVKDNFTHNLKTQGDFHFPIFENIWDSDATAKINTFLQLEILELIIGTEDSIIFENDWPNGEIFSGRQRMDYQIKSNTSKILSIVFDCEGCGAYCSDYKMYYNFDSQSGDFINLKDLFSEEGYNKFTSIVIGERINRINKAIKQCKDNFELWKNDFNETSKRPKIEIEEIIASEQAINEDEISTYKNCLEYLNSLEYDGYYFEDDELYLIREKCSVHVNQALDNLGEFENVFNYSLLKDHLNGYGDYFFNPQELEYTKCNPNLKNKLFFGKIDNKYPIVFAMIDEHGYQKYYYSYLKYCRKIELEKGTPDEYIRFMEPEDSVGNYAIIAIKEVNKKFEGFWYKNKIKYSLELQTTPITK